MKNGHHNYKRDLLQILGLLIVLALFIWLGFKNGEFGSKDSVQGNTCFEVKPGSGIERDQRNINFVSADQVSSNSKDNVTYEVIWKCINNGSDEWKVSLLDGKFYADNKKVNTSNTVGSYENTATIAPGEERYISVLVQAKSSVKSLDLKYSPSEWSDNILKFIIL